MNHESRYSGLIRALLFHRVQRKSVFTLKVNAAFTVLRILTRSMFNMVLGAVISFLLMNPHRTMAMHTTNGLVKCTQKSDRHLNPAPIPLFSKHESLFLFALSHEDMWHEYLPPVGYLLRDLRAMDRPISIQHGRLVIRLLQYALKSRSFGVCISIPG